MNKITHLFSIAVLSFALNFPCDISTELSPSTTSSLQSSNPVYIIRTKGKEYLLKNYLPKDSLIKKEWLSNVYVVKEIEKTKYKKLPQSKYGVIIFEINDLKFPLAMDTIAKMDIEELRLLNNY